MLKSLPFLPHHIFSPAKTTKRTEKGHSEEEINSSRFPWKFLKELLYSLASPPHLKKRFFYILGSLTLPLASNRMALFAPDTPGLLLLILQNYQQHPFQSQKCPSVQDKLHSHSPEPLTAFTPWGLVWPQRSSVSSIPPFQHKCPVHQSRHSQVSKWLTDLQLVRWIPTLPKS